MCTKTRNTGPCAEQSNHHEATTQNGRLVALHGSGARRRTPENAMKCGCAVAGWLRHCNIRLRRIGTVNALVQVQALIALCLLSQVVCVSIRVVVLP